MESQQFEFHPVSIKKRDLGTLQTLLSYQLSGTFLLVLSYIYFVTVYIATIAAIIFIPFLLKVLWKEKKYGWIISFVILIIIPPIVIFLLLNNMTWFYVSLFISLGIFYTYCVILKWAIPEWVG